MEISPYVNDNLENIKFISDEIRNYIKENFKYSVKIINDNFILTVITDDITESSLNEIYDYTVTSFYGLNKYYKFLEKRKNKVIIDYYPTPFEKLFRTDCKPLSRENINSGVTIHNDRIKIWRKEEYSKVLIHELIHWYKLENDFTLNVSHPIELKLDTNENDIEVRTELQTWYMYYKIYGFIDDNVEKEVIYSYNLSLNILMYNFNCFGKIIKSDTSLMNYFLL